MQGDRGTGYRRGAAAGRLGDWARRGCGGEPEAWLLGGCSGRVVQVQAAGSVSWGYVWLQRRGVLLGWSCGVEQPVIGNSGGGTRLCVRVCVCAFFFLFSLLFLSSHHQRGVLELR